MDQETSDLIDELVAMLVETQLEVTALHQIIVDRKLADDEEIRMRMDDIKFEETIRLKREVRHRAWEKALKERLKQ
jgi:hypothetical protein